MLARDSGSELQDRISLSSSAHSQGNNPSLKERGDSSVTNKIMFIILNILFIL